MTDINHNTMVNDTEELTEDEMMCLMMFAMSYGDMFAKLDDEATSEEELAG